MDVLLPKPNLAHVCDVDGIQDVGTQVVTVLVGDEVADAQALAAVHNVVVSELQRLVGSVSVRREGSDDRGGIHPRPVANAL